MAVVTDTWVTDSLLLLLSLLALFYWFFTRTANYFRDRGIPYLPQVPVVGCTRLYSKSQIDLSLDLYNTFPEERFFGYFQTRVPLLLIKDPDLVHKVFVKDFAYFHDRGFAIAEHDTLNNNLSNLKGKTWRNLRHKLIPIFSTGKLKHMFDQLDKCGDSLITDLDKVVENRESVNIRLFIAGFTSEVIGTTAFGLDMKRDSPQSLEFNNKTKNLFDISIKGIIFFLSLMIFPKLINMLKLAVTPKEVTEYFVNLVKANKDYRKQNKIKRNDFFQLLLNLQETEASGSYMGVSVHEKSEEDELIDQMEFTPQDLDESSEKTALLTDESLTAQSFAFLTAGTESVSGTLGYVLYHLGKDVSIQRTAQQEVDNMLAKHGKCTYQAIKEMTYLDLIIQEALRLYPVLALTMRECTARYQIPDSDKVIEKGTIVTIPVAGLQMDPNFYPEPNVFNPERFIDNNFKPSPTYMPFGDGPRICIGMRFAILEMKVCLCKIVSKYSVLVDPKTKEPFIFERKSFFPRPEGGIWLKFNKRSQVPL